MNDSDADDSPGRELSLPPNAPVYGSRHVDIRLDSEGEGVIEISTRGTEFEFTVDGEQVQQFAEKLSNTDREFVLEQPECLSEAEVVVPEGWEKGTVVHTGGGFWCRVFEKPYLDGRIEVAYNVENLHGVGAGVYDSEGYYKEIENRSLPSDADEHAALAKAYELIEEIDNGEHDILDNS